MEQQLRESHQIAPPAPAHPESIGAPVNPQKVGEGAGATAVDSALHAEPNEPQTLGRAVREIGYEARGVVGDAKKVFRTDERGQNNLLFHGAGGGDEAQEKYDDRAMRITANYRDAQTKQHEYEKRGGLVGAAGGAFHGVRKAFHNFRRWWSISGEDIDTRF